MAYRNPRFYFRHELRRIGSAAIGGSTFSTANPRAYVHDSGLGRNGAFNAAAVNQFVKGDRGIFGAVLGDLDTIIIPTGGTVSGTPIEVRHHTSDPPDGVTGTLIFGPTAPAQIIHTLSTAMSNRYFSVTVPASGAWTFPEIILTERRTTTRGPDPEWKDAKVANQFEAQMRSGETYRLELGAERRFYEFTYRALSGADLDVFTDMRTETRNGLYPIYVDHPNDNWPASADEPPLLMQIVGGLEFEQDFAVPTSGAQYKLTLRLLEVLA